MIFTLVFDTETTGLPLHAGADLRLQPQCIEFGAVLLDASGQAAEEVSILIDPGCALPAEIVKITGITDADLLGADSFAQALPKIEAVFAKASVGIAHNLAFDKSIIEFELARLGRPEFPWPRQLLCTVEETMAEWGRRPKMKELYEATLGRPLAQTHRALDDAKALAEIVVALGLFAK